MTNRERFLAILSGNKVDRMPAVHFGYWRELIEEWVQAGYISRELANERRDGNEADRELDRMLGWDFCYTSRGYAHMGLLPPFEEEVIKKENGGVYTRGRDGVIHFEKEGTMGIPQDVDYLLKDRQAFEELFKPKMLFSPERLLDVNYYTTILKEEIRKHHCSPRVISGGEGLGRVRDMLTLTGLSYMLFDDYELLKEIVDTWANMQYECVKRVLETGVKFDAMHFWEDICYKNGPLVPPEVFRELCFDNYKRIVDLGKEYGIKYFSVDCDGDTSALWDTWYQAGVNVMFPIEYGTWQASIAKMRDAGYEKMYGIGGVNKDIFRQDKEAVDREIKRIKELVLLGGYIPCPDHRIQSGAKFELIKYYTEEIKKI